MIGWRKPRPSRLHKLNYILQINVALFRGPGRDPHCLMFSRPLVIHLLYREQFSGYTSAADTMNGELVKIALFLQLI